MCKRHRNLFVTTVCVQRHSCVCVQRHSCVCVQRHSCVCVQRHSTGEHYIYWKVFIAQRHAYKCVVLSLIL